MSLVMVLGGLAGIIGGIALGLVGIGICACAYPIFKKKNKKAKTKVEPLLESEYDKLADLCEQAATLTK